MSSPPRLLFVADLHMTGTPAPLQRRILSWIGHLVAEHHPEILVFAGDMLQTGTRREMATLARELDRAHILRRGNREASGPQLVWLPGNRDRGLASLLPRTGDYSRVILSTSAERLGTARLVFANSEQESIGQAVAESLAHGPRDPGPVIVLAHRDAGITRAILSRLHECPPRAGETLVLLGHGHEPVDRPSGAIRIVQSAGLDWSRTIGGGPDALLVEMDEQEHPKVIRLKPTLGDLLPRQCRSIEIGIAPRGPLTSILVRATEERIRAVQLTAPAVGVPEVDGGAIRRWREAVPHTHLSLHLPTPDMRGAAPLGGLDAFFVWGRSVGVADYTVHLPNLPAGDVLDERDVLCGPKADALLCVYERLGATAIDQHATLSIENLHNHSEHAAGGSPDRLSTRPEHLLGPPH